MKKTNRVFVIVIDSLGIGAMQDSPDFGDVGVNTLGHISEAVETFEIPNLQKLGLANIIPLKQVPPVEKPLAYYAQLEEKSLGKDTMTGHWEMMGKVKNLHRLSQRIRALTTETVIYIWHLLLEVGSDAE